MIDIIIGVVLGILVGGIVASILVKRRNPEDMQAEVAQQLKAVLPEILSQSTEDLVRIANEKLGSEKKEIRTDLENKRSEIERLIKVMQQDLKESKKSLDDAEKERIGGYKALHERLDEYKTATDQLKVSTDNLKNLLSNNQLRGQFGEQVAEELLQMTGFVKGQHYEFNKEQAGSETRPDFAIFMPDGKRINVDAKFPYANLQKMAETDDKGEKDRYLKLFEQDVKQKIKQVVGRDYINPTDNTVDFVILFIPNEMIFSFIYDKLNEVWTDAMAQKVVLAGPFSFTAILRMVYQAYDNFRVTANIQNIITYVKDLEKEFGKFSDEFSKVGDRIDSLSKQYQTVNGTRINQMKRVMDKVLLEDEQKEPLKLLDEDTPSL